MKPHGILLKHYNYITNNLVLLFLTCLRPCASSQLSASTRQRGAALSVAVTQSTATATATLLLPLLPLLLLLLLLLLLTPDIRLNCPPILLLPTGPIRHAYSLFRRNFGLIWYYVLHLAAPHERYAFPTCVLCTPALIRGSLWSSRAPNMI